MESLSTRLIHILVALALVFPWNASIASQVAQPARAEAQVFYRLRVVLQNSSSRGELEQLGARILDSGEGWALVLASASQLQDLARLRFQPSQVDELYLLVQSHRLDKPWLVTSLSPLLQDQSVADSAGKFELTSFSPGQLDAISGLTSVDSDSDGLSDTEESWWCTNPNNPDSDSDTATDGQEITQLLAGNRTNGKPFLSWPQSIPGCYDDDYDSVPDLAETNVVGLSINRESTDLDKYDDGQEFFGSTYCPGGPGSCGYGALPRTQDLYLGSNMPSFVQAPANSPFVAAFPDPSVSIVDGSLNVQAVTTVTTDHTITNGESHVYESSTTKGTSTSNYDLKTWNDWQEVKDGNETASETIFEPNFLLSPETPNGLDNWIMIGGETVAIVSTLTWLGTVAGGVVCAASVVCGVAVVAAGTIALAAYRVSVVRELEDAGVFDETTTPDEVQSIVDPYKCSEAGPGTFTCVPDEVVDQQEQDLINMASILNEDQDRPTSESDTNYTETINNGLVVCQS